MSQRTELPLGWELGGWLKRCSLSGFFWAQSGPTAGWGRWGGWWLPWVPPRGSPWAGCALASCLPVYSCTPGRSHLPQGLCTDHSLCLGCCFPGSSHTSSFHCLVTSGATDWAGEDWGREGSSGQERQELPFSHVALGQDGPQGRCWVGSGAQHPEPREGVWAGGRCLGVYGLLDFLQCHHLRDTRHNPPVIIGCPWFPHWSFKGHCLLSSSHQCLCNIILVGYRCIWGLSMSSIGL